MGSCGNAYEEVDTQQFYFIMKWSRGSGQCLGGAVGELNKTGEGIK